MRDVIAMAMRTGDLAPSAAKAQSWKAMRRLSPATTLAGFGKMYSETALVAVTGSMRSGASLIGHILQLGRDGARAHPELAFDNDRSKWVRQFFEAVRLSCEPVAAYGDPFRVESLTKPTLERFYGEAINDLSTGLDRIRNDFLEEIQSWSGPGPLCTFFGLKRTSMNYEVGVLQDIFPNLKLVLSVRDPRDVFHSYLIHLGRTGLEQRSGDVFLILAYVLGNYYFIEHLRRQSTKPLVIKYEAIVRDLRSHVPQLLKFIGLDEGRYDFTFVTGSERLRNSFFTGISTRRVGGFRTTVEPDIVAFIEVLCAPVFAAYGYQRASPRAKWRSVYQNFVDDMQRSCAERHISFAPVARRLQELGVREGVT